MKNPYYSEKYKKCYDCSRKGIQPTPGCREGLPWERIQSWWLGEAEEISRSRNNLCIRPREEKKKKDPEKRQ